MPVGYGYMHTVAMCIPTCSATTEDACICQEVKFGEQIIFIQSVFTKPVKDRTCDLLIYSVLTSLAFL